MVLGRKTTEVSALLIIYEMYIPFTSFTLLELILIPWLRWSSSGFSTIKSLCWGPEISVRLYTNYTSIKEGNEKKASRRNKQKNNDHRNYKPQMPIVLM